MQEWRESLSRRPQLLVGEDNMKTTWISVLVGMASDDLEKEEAMGLALKMFLEREARIKDAASRQFETVHQMLEEVNFQKFVQGDHSQLQKPSADQVPTLLAADGMLLLLMTA